LNLSKQVLSDYSGAYLPVFAPEIWVKILTHNLVAEAPFVDPIAVSPYEHFQRSLLGTGGSDPNDNRSVGECIKSVYGPGKSFAIEKVDTNIIMVLKACCASSV